MKDLTLAEIDWKPDTSFFTPAETRAWYGVDRKVKAIACHWWNTPAKAGTLSQTIKYLQGVDESIHFIASGSKVVQMVNMANTAFHAVSGNPISVGVEFDPNKLTEKDYAYYGRLVKFIRKYYGNIPLVPHSSYIATSCPGLVDLKKIDDYATGRKVWRDTPKPAPKPAPKPKPAPITQTVKTDYEISRSFKVIKQTTLVNIPDNTKYANSRTYKVGEIIHDVVEKTKYSNGAQFYRTKYARDTAKKMYGFNASSIEEVITPPVTPKPEPPKPTESDLEALKKQVDEQSKLVDKIVQFLASIFKSWK